MIEEDSAFPVEGIMLTIRTSQNHTRFNLQAITNLEYIHLEFMLLHLDLFKDSWCCVFRRRN